jgi:phage shock protein A
MQEALEAFRKSRAAAASAAATAGAAGSNAEQRMGAVTGAFDRLYQRQTGLSGTDRTASLEQTARLKELDDLVRENKIAERMAQIKAGKA